VAARASRSLIEKRLMEISLSEFQDVCHIAAAGTKNPGRRSPGFDDF
jgi:hypothetical protein